MLPTDEPEFANVRPSTVTVPFGIDTLLVCPALLVDPRLTDPEMFEVLRSVPLGNAMITAPEEFPDEQEGL